MSDPFVDLVTFQNKQSLFGSENMKRPLFVRYAHFKYFILINIRLCFPMQMFHVKYAIVKDEHNNHSYFCDMIDETIAKRQKNGYKR